MNRLTIPTAAVEPLRAAMTCRCPCHDRSDPNYDHADEASCDDCPPTFWLGVPGEPAQPERLPDDYDVLGLLVLPDNVRAMLKPCETCDGKGIAAWEDAGPNGPLDEPEPIICPNCKGRGFPLVELVTKCPHPYHDTSRLDGGWGVCVPGACQNGTISLGRVTATGRELEVFDRLIPPVNVRPGEWLAMTGKKWVRQTCDGSHLTTHPQPHIVVLLADHPTHAVEVQVVT